MARTSISYQQVVRTGLTESLAAANADGHKFSNDGRIVLHVVNGGASPITVTIQTPNTVDDLAVSDRTVTISDEAEKIIGPFPPGIYNQSDGMVYVDFSAVSSVTVSALRV